MLNTTWKRTAEITLPLRRRSSPASAPKIGAAAAVQGPTARCTDANSTAETVTAATPARADVYQTFARLNLI